MSPGLSLLLAGAFLWGCGAARNLPTASENAVATPLDFLVERAGEEVRRQGRMGEPKVEKHTVSSLGNPTDEQLRLREAWLKN